MKKSQFSPILETSSKQIQEIPQHPHHSHVLLEEVCQSDSESSSLNARQLLLEQEAPFSFPIESWSELQVALRWLLLYELDSKPIPLPLSLQDSLKGSKDP